LAEDYSNFSWEAIQEDLRELRAEMIDRAVTAGFGQVYAEEMVDYAFSISGRNFMEVNGFREPNRQD
jgi:hypothetical protein